jgi:hypothetical protein
MYKTMRAAGIVLMAATVWAQTQVATVTSSTAFTLRGAAITPGQGVPMWPVLAGDDVTAGNAITIVTFPDGSVITLAPGAAGKFGLVNGQPSFELAGGTAHYSLKSKKAVVMIVGGQTVALTNETGTLPLSAAKGGGFWTAGHIAAVAIVGGAAAAGAGVAASDATGGGAPVSPSK